MQAGGQSDVKEQLELFIRCFNLIDTDVMSKSDPYVEVSIQNRGGPKQKVGQTETIRDNLNPAFQKTILVDYYFEMQQTLHFEVRDQDESSADNLGAASCNMAQIVMTGQDGLTLPLTNKKNKGSTINIKFQKTGDTGKMYSFRVKCTKVKDIEVFSKSDPFLRIYRPTPNYEQSPGESIPENGWVMVHETEYYQDNLNPVFNPFTINGSQINRNNPKMVNKWEIWDHSNRGKHELIGWGFFSVADILQVKRFYETRDKKKGFAGNILIDDIREIKQYPLSSYLRMGVNLNLTVGVDFTGSNGIASAPSSLHYMGGGPNQYMQAISQVGMIVCEYDNDKMIPAYGFGAKLRGTPQTSHCFPLTLNPEQHFVSNYTGVLQAYTQCVNKLEFSGPTNFSPIINECLKAVQAGFGQNKLVYSILMILTDGLITDFQETCNAIVACSKLPISIIIIGVGNEDFSQMDKLDADVQPLKNSQGQPSARDIVQFVPFRDFANSQHSLAEAVLRELPKQIDQFYQMIGMVPPN